MAIHWLTQSLKFLLINLRNLLLKNTFFQGGVKIHPPSGDKGLKIWNLKFHISAEEEDYVYEYADYGEDYDEYYGEEAVDCSNYEASLKKLEDLEEKSCSEFAEDGYRCVPFFACNGGEIVTNGAG